MEPAVEKPKGRSKGKAAKKGKEPSKAKEIKDAEPETKERAKKEAKAKEAPTKVKEAPEPDSPASPHSTPRGDGALARVKDGRRNGAPSPARDDEEDEARKEEEASPYILELYTSDEGYALKVVFEMISALMGEELYLAVTRDRVYYSAVDKKGDLVVQFELDGQKLTSYKAPHGLKGADDACVFSAVTAAVAQCTKAKAKASMRLYILKREPKQMCVDIVDSNKDATKTSNRFHIGGHAGYVPVDVPQYPETLRPMTRISGPVFQNKCKTLGTFHATTRVAVQKEGLMFTAGSPDTKQTNPTFGTWSDEPNAPLLFSGDFPSLAIATLAKCGSISKQVAVLVMRGKPLKLMADIGSLGTFHAHLYSKEQ
jgi:hypothetical protein